jgi:hypothetical protein
LSAKTLDTIVDTAKLTAKAVAVKANDAATPAAVVPAAAATIKVPTIFIPLQMLRQQACSPCVCNQSMGHLPRLTYTQNQCHQLEA